MNCAKGQNLDGIEALDEKRRTLNANTRKNMENLTSDLKVIKHERKMSI